MTRRTESFQRTPNPSLRQSWGNTTLKRRKRISAEKTKREWLRRSSKRRKLDWGTSSSSRSLSKSRTLSSLKYTSRLWTWASIKVKRISTPRCQFSRSTIKSSWTTSSSTLACTSKSSTRKKTSTLSGSLSLIGCVSWTSLSLEKRQRTPPSACKKSISSKFHSLTH